LTRKKESDLYEEKKQKLEKELTDKKTAFEKAVAERETNLKIAENELAELRKKNEAFPAELEKAVAMAVKTATEKTETIFGFQKELREKEISGELKLKEQTIQTLNAKIKDLEASLKELSQKTVTAETSVKDIAMKAIEHSSKPYFIEKQKDGSGKE
jgi:chromosome segregation ATPase